MSSSKADGAASLDFLANISIGTQDAHARPGKKPKPPQTRHTTSQRAHPKDKSSKGASSEHNESKKSNSRHTGPTGDNSPSKHANAGAHKTQDAISTPPRRKDSHSSRHAHGEHRDHKHDKASKLRDSAAYDFLSGISLGGTSSHGHSDNASRDWDRSSHHHQTPSRGNSSKSGSTPSKSIPIAVSGPSVTFPSNASFQSDSTMDENMASMTPDTESGLPDTTKVLFGVPDEHPPEVVIVPSTVVSSKAFSTAPKKLVKSMASGQRTLYAFPSAAPSHQGRPHNPKTGLSQTSSQHSRHHRNHGIHDQHSRLHQPRIYGAVLISSVLCHDRDTSSSSANANHSSSLNYHHHSYMGGNGLGVGGSSPSDASDEEHGGRRPRHGIRMLQFKKKSVSVSYQRYLVPSAKSAELNRQIIARLPTFSLPRTLMMSPLDIFHSNDELNLMDSTSPSGSTPRTPSRRKQSKEFDASDSPRTPTGKSGKSSNSRIDSLARSNTLSSLEHPGSILAKTGDPVPTYAKTDSGEIEGVSQTATTDAQGKGKSKSSRSKTSTGEIDEPDQIPPTKPRSQSMSAQPTIGFTTTLPQVLPDLTPVSASHMGPEALPQSPPPGLAPTAAPANAAPLTRQSSASKFQSMDPYQRCLQSYDPGFLDHDIEKSGKYLVKSHLPGYTSSILPLKPAKLVRVEENEAFANRHTWLTTDLKLSKLRSVKRKLEQVGISTKLDIACTAFSYVYFEKLILQNVVWNHNARLLGAVCLLLATKYYGVKTLTFAPVVKELASKLKVPSKEIVGNEFYVYRKLKFALFVEDEEVMPHFWKLRSSPTYLDKEFQVTNKERKKNLKKQQQAAAAAAAAAAAQQISSPAM